MFKVIIFLTLLIILKFLLKNKKIESFSSNNKILFLMRSYNRPEYLKETLKYLDKSDVNKCIKKIIYDDKSNKETLNVLKEYENKYDIIYNTKNYKQKSMVKFLDIIIKKYNNFDYICYLDNDAISKPNFIEKCINTFNLIKQEQNLKNNKIILTGFNTKTHKVIQENKNYIKKKSIGGIHMFFHKSLIYKIRDWWYLNEDWGIVKEFKKEQGEFYCTNPSVIQHIGKIGDNSNNKKYDKSEDF